MLDEVPTRRNRRGRYRLLGLALLVVIAIIALVLAQSSSKRHTSAPTATPTTATPTTPSGNSNITVNVPAVLVPNPAQKSCSPTPHLCGYPDATTTGITPGTTLKPSGCINASTNNQVIQDLTITNCTIDVSARNVTIRNVKMVVNSPSLWAIVVRPGASATVDHTDISGVDENTKVVEFAVLSLGTSPVVVTNNNFYKCSDCIQGEDITAFGNYIHDLAGPPDAHLDGIQCDSQHGCQLTAVNNTVLGAGIAIALYGDFGVPANSTISGNLVGGGSYTIYGGTTASTNVHIDDNRFSRYIHPDGGLYGPLAYFVPGNSGNTFSGNIWDDTGLPVEAS